MPRLASFASILALVAALGCNAPAQTRPNLLLVSVDTLRPDRLACYGGAPDAGGRICELGERGVRYTWAFATAPATAPSVASLLTSRYPAQHRVSQFAISFLDGKAVTLAETLSAAGYTTAAFVCNPVIGHGRNLDQGFDIYDANMTRREVNRPGLAERDAASVTDAALAWARVAQSPFFLWVHYQDPHGPYDPPQRGAPPQDPPHGTKLPLLEDHSGHGGIPAYQAIPGLQTLEAYQQRYLDEIRFLDSHLGRLLDGLEALGAPLGTLLTADHGEAFGEDGYYLAHGHSVGLEQIRVPLLWRPPGGAGGSVVREAVSIIDAAPTLLAAAGVEIPAAFEGRVLPLADADAPAPRALFAEHRMRTAVLTGDLYYARDRRDLEEPAADRISGGRLRALPARVAHLPPDGATPAYAAAAERAETQPLEQTLAGFLASAQSQEAQGGRLSEETQEQLRALGYLE